MVRSSEETLRTRLLANAYTAWTAGAQSEHVDQAWRKAAYAHDARLRRAWVKRWKVAACVSLTCSVDARWFIARGAAQRMLFCWVQVVEYQRKLLGSVLWQCAERRMRRTLGSWKIGRAHV